MTIERAIRMEETMPRQRRVGSCHVFSHEALLPEDAPESLLALAWKETKDGFLLLPTEYQTIFQRAGYGYDLYSLDTTEQVSQLIGETLRQPEVLGAVVHLGYPNPPAHAVSLQIETGIDNQPRLRVADLRLEPLPSELYLLTPHLIARYAEELLPPMQAYSRIAPEQGNIALITRGAAA